MGNEEEEKEEGKRRPGNKCRRLSERGSYVLQELFKLRRMTLPQLARLLGLSAERNGALFVVYRLESLGFVRRESVAIGTELVSLVRLTDQGARWASEALGRAVRESARDDVQFYAHLLKTGDLYLELVREGAKNWIEARERAASFVWLASNDDTQFLWQAMREFDAGRKRYRRVVPDVTIETDTHRFLVEIEKSTKSLRAVDVKIAQYCAVFSPLKSAGDRPAYQQKYGDAKRPAVLFVFETEARAENARRLFERRAREQNFRIPEWHCGTVESTAALLRKNIRSLGPVKPRPAPAATCLTRADHDLLRAFFVQSLRELRAVQDAVSRGQMPAPPKNPPSFEAYGEFLRQHDPVNGVPSKT